MTQGPWPQQPPEPDPQLAGEDDWQRLDPRMLVVHPVGAVLRFLPVLIGVFIAGSASGGGLWQFGGILIPIGLGVAQYYTTTFRIHAGRIELRRGLLSRQVRSTAVDRVRTVDLTAPLIHRVLGLTMMRIGTGTSGGEDQLDLDGLPSERARELRSALLRAAPPVDGPDAGPHASPGEPAGPGAEASVGSLDPPGGVRAATPVARFAPAWLRFAPFTSSGLVIAGATLGLLSQVGDQAGLFRRIDPDSIIGSDPTPSALLVGLGIVVLLVLVSFFAVLGYLVTNWGYELTHGAGAWHVRRGLLTTRETTLDEERVAGVVMGEQAGLRLARGRRLAAIVTGLDASQQTSSSLTPPAPTDVVLGAAAAVLGTDTPLTGPLTPHGPAAVRRRWIRALVPAVLVGSAGVVAVVLGAPVWVLVVLLGLPLGTLLAADRSRALGHALSEGYVVARSGSLTRKRSVLGADHVIGWNLRATWFQRRAGLTTLVATTAGGSQSVTVLDLPEELAVALAGQAVPELVTQFLAAGDSPGRGQPAGPQVDRRTTRGEEALGR